MLVTGLKNAGKDPGPWVGELVFIKLTLISLLLVEQNHRLLDIQPASLPPPSPLAPAGWTGEQRIKVAGPKEVSQVGGTK